MHESQVSFSDFIYHLGVDFLTLCQTPMNLHLRMQIFVGHIYIDHVIGPTGKPGRLFPLFERHNLISVALAPKDPIST